jgi:glycosyltransferase involved in cell wall biosynthesis
MPTYERTDLLSGALESVLQQTFTDFEVIIGDNSKSNTVQDLVESYNDPRITYHRNDPPTEAGPHNVLYNMKRVTTPYACILCYDDLLKPSYLEELLQPLLLDPDLDVAFCDYDVIDGQGQVQRGETEAASQRSGRSSLSTGPLSSDRFTLMRLGLGQHAIRLSWAAVFKTQTFLRFQSRPEHMYVDDLAVVYNMVVGGSRFFYVADRLS